MRKYKSPHFLVQDLLNSTIFPCPTSQIISCPLPSITEVLQQASDVVCGFFGLYLKEKHNISLNYCFHLHKCTPAYGTCV